MDRSVAQVAVDMPLANLDRPFDYAVPAELSDVAQPGVRVKVRFAGRLRDGFIVARVEPGERKSLSPLEKVVSAEPVLSAAVRATIRSVADRYAGSFADVVRAAVPPRHAATEKASATPRPAPNLAGPRPESMSRYPGADRFLAAVAEGGHPRAAWTVAPALGAAGHWQAGLVEAAAATLRAGRGALLLAPDATALETLESAVKAAFGKGSYAVLSNDLGPAARYRNFLAVSRGHTKLAIGTRAAVFAPVAKLGLIGMWDDGNDSFAEAHAPYWHAREVAALRAHQESCALLFAAYSRTCEVQHLIAGDWLAGIELSPKATRMVSAAVRISSRVSDRDPLAEQARLPKDAFATIRRGLLDGPVLVQVPRAGYRPVLVCSRCRTVARCPTCGQPLADSGVGPATCSMCGPSSQPWRCGECGESRLRSAAVGVRRTAEELGRAFPGVSVVQSSAEQRRPEVGEGPALVLATPGAEPYAATGYSAAVLLDADRVLARADLRAGEEALRRWLSVVAKVRAAEAGGTVLVVASPQAREVQALLRLDPVGYARSELDQRAEAGFPPVVKLIWIEGPLNSLGDLARELGESASVIGPFEIDSAGAGGPGSAGSDRGSQGPGGRLTIRCDHRASAEILAEIHQARAARAARKESPWRVVVDPQVFE